MQEIKNEELSAVQTAEVAVTDTKSIALPIIQFIALLSVAIFAPAINVQAVTGTLVNATLFIATVLLGVPAAILIGFIPSAISSATGMLAPALAAMVPFIILSNAVLVGVFSRSYKKSYWKGAITASFVKFAILSLVSTFIIGYFVSEAAASKLAVMMNYPQLYTALSGAVLAYVVLRSVKKFEE
jgi:uncharacterized membrane protein